MKIVITSQGEDLSSAVDPRFGRAATFILYDLETDEWKAVDNAQNLNALRGAGIQAAESAAKLEAGAVVTGHCGPNAFRTLNAAGIKLYVGCEGTVAEAVEAFKAGKLQEADAADVEGHWM